MLSAHIRARVPLVGGPYQRVAMCVRERKRRRRRRRVY
jgi:hypothetical protein